MKVLALFLLLLVSSGGGKPTIVYVCYGTKAKKYHLHEHCRGLRNCQHRLVKMKLSDARKMGYTLCGWEK